MTRRIASTILDFAECRYSRITDPPFLLSTPPSTHSLLLSEARMAPMIQACNGGRRRSTAYPDLLHGKKNQTNPQESVQTRSRLVWGYRLRHLPRGVWVCLGCGVSVRWHDLCINTPFPPGTPLEAFQYLYECRGSLYTGTTSGKLNHPSASPEAKFDTMSANKTTLYSVLAPLQEFAHRSKPLRQVPHKRHKSSGTANPSTPEALRDSSA